MIAGVFVLKGGVPGLPKTPPFISAAKGPTKVQPPSEETVAASKDAGASLLKDSTQLARVKVVNSEEQPVDLTAQASLANAPAAPASAPAATGATQRRDARRGAARPAGARRRLPRRSIRHSWRRLSLPRRRWRCNFRTPSPSGPFLCVRTGRRSRRRFPPRRIRAHCRMRPTRRNRQPRRGRRRPAAAVGAAQSSTPKLDLPTKLSGKSSARVVVAKTDTTAPGAAAETNPPLQLGVAGKPEKPEPSAKARKSEQAAAEPPAAPRQPVDPTPATTSGGWAVQLAAPKSEAEAKSRFDAPQRQIRIRSERRDDRGAQGPRQT